MSRPQFNRSQTNVEDWLSGKYEYIGPDNMDQDKGTKIYPHIRQNLSRDHTPEDSEKGSSRGKGHSTRSSIHDQSRPITPPSEETLEKERTRALDSDRHRHRARRDEDERPRHHHKEEPRGYPPRSDRGRPKRPPLNTAVTTPDFSRDKDKDRVRHRPRRLSHSSSPPPRRRDAEDEHRRHQHHHHHHHRDREPSSAHSSGGHHKDRRDRDRDRDSTARSYAGSNAGSTTQHNTSSAKKPRRPSLAGPAPGGRRRSSFSFLSDPRFTAAATAALNAGATAAVGSFGAPNSGAKVARAALGAAAMNAFKTPVDAGKTPAESLGGYAAGRKERRR